MALKAGPEWSQAGVLAFVYVSKQGQESTVLSRNLCWTCVPIFEVLQNDTNNDDNDNNNDYIYIYIYTNNNDDNNNDNDKDTNTNDNHNSACEEAAREASSGGFAYYKQLVKTNIGLD